MDLAAGFMSRFDSVGGLGGALWLTLVGLVEAGLWGISVGVVGVVVLDLFAAFRDIFPFVFRLLANFRVLCLNLLLQTS